MYPHSGQTRASRNPESTRRLSHGECRDWLSSHREGRLGYQTGRGPQSVVVCYALTDEQVVFQLPDYNDIVHYAPGERVTLEVDGLHAAVGQFETVTVTGQAQRVTEQDGSAIAGSHLDEQWPSSLSTTVIRLPMTDVEGYQVPTVARGAGSRVPT